jgi:hypothetical protein
MEAARTKRLKEYIQALQEKDVWTLLQEYFLYRRIMASKVHAPGEHGMDVVVYINDREDLLGKGYNILIQAKTGKLTLDGWRKDILYQMLETPYYSIPHPNYQQQLARRVLLVITDTATPEARDSIIEFNKKHEVVIELWEIDDLLRHFDESGFNRVKLEEIEGVGQESLGDDVELPPTVGHK